VFGTPGEPFCSADLELALPGGYLALKKRHSTQLTQFFVLYMLYIYALASVVLACPNRGGVGCGHVPVRSAQCMCVLYMVCAVL
jgi:hypothetical protein